ncbi:uncharacterized protein [Anas platyrhynchos]|uniref:uncharacterized protein n=1 Tax=Anas platyrhynchos TaxID=8839 RepID=UPI003AF2A553
MARMGTAAEAEKLVLGWASLGPGKWWCGSVLGMASAAWEGKPAGDGQVLRWAACLAPKPAVLPKMSARGWSAVGTEPPLPAFPKQPPHSPATMAGPAAGSRSSRGCGPAGEPSAPELSPAPFFPQRVSPDGFCGLRRRKTPPSSSQPCRQRWLPGCFPPSPERWRCPCSPPRYPPSPPHCPRPPSGTWCRGSRGRCCSSPPGCSCHLGGTSQPRGTTCSLGSSPPAAPCCGAAPPQRSCGCPQCLPAPADVDGDAGAPGWCSPLLGAQGRAPWGAPAPRRHLPAAGPCLPRPPTTPHDRASAAGAGAPRAPHPQQQPGAAAGALLACRGAQRGPGAPAARPHSPRACPGSSDCQHPDGDARRGDTCRGT